MSSFIRVNRGHQSLTENAEHFGLRHNLQTKHTTTLHAQKHSATRLQHHNTRKKKQNKGYSTEVMSNTILLRYKHKDY